MTVHDRPGYAPLINNKGLIDVAHRCMAALVGEEKLTIHNEWYTGCSDIGDVSCVMPCLHPHIAGARGTPHGEDYRIADAECACVTSAVGQLLMAAELLRDGAKTANAILSDYTPPYESKEAYFQALDAFMQSRALVSYDGDGKAAVQY